MNYKEKVPAPILDEETIGCFVFLILRILSFKQ